MRCWFGGIYILAIKKTDDGNIGLNIDDFNKETGKTKIKNKDKD